MITRFRVEGWNENKDLLIIELSHKVSEIISLIDQQGQWECTDDVTSFDRLTKLHKGRMVMVYRGNTYEGV